MKKKLGQVVELQKNHIVLFKSPREVMQFSTFTVKLGLGTKRVDCYWDVTSVPDGYLLIDLSPRKNDRLRSFTNYGLILSYSFLPKRLKDLQSLDDESTNSPYSPDVSFVFP